jgi:hypothetical protein
MYKNYSIGRCLDLGVEVLGSQLWPQLYSRIIDALDGLRRVVVPAIMSARVNMQASPLHFIQLTS